MVYVADHGLVAIKDGFNIPMTGVLLASHPLVAKYPARLRALGTVDAAGAAYINMLGTHAVLRQVAHLITPLGIEPDLSETTGVQDSGPDSPDGNLPGGLTWPKIEATYRRLAGEPTGWRSRRSRPDEPSRPETAKALGTSPATLKRACAAAGKGTKWPPAGL